MNREDIIRMAVDAGIIPWTKHEYVGGKNFSASDEGLDGDLASLIQFAALVASAEREACAKLCWSQRKYWDAEACADAIRARGQA
tara:strand:+ start:414 stop:668 length:255 start_codon:yes stop_codon:yes gene_type:complete